MQSPVKDARRSDLHLPEFERPSIDLKDMKMPKIDLSDIDMPKVDVGKAVLGAATAVGLAKPRRARWPYLVVAGVAVAVTGWALMNAEAIRTRLGRAATWANEHLGAMRSRDEFDEPVAFTAAPTAPIAHPADTSLSPSATTDYPSATSDYPDGLGSTESKATNGRSTATSPR
jgi:hypothetical protein